MKTIWIWLKRLAFGLTAFVTALGLSSVTYQFAASKADARNFPPPGRLVEVGRYRLHIYCMGTESPTVILDASNMGTVSTWAWIQPEIAKTNRVCAYDRPALGWSDLSPEPLDTRQKAQALHTLLGNVGERGPFVLVGHSFGGLHTRVFAKMYPEEITGMVLIEGTLSDGLKKLCKPDMMPNAPDAGYMAATPFISHLGILHLMSFPPTNHIMVTVQGANHASLVNRCEHAMQTSAAILKIVGAARSGQHLQ
jgi:pimeloyl-ACP methyl ester carboxylesterase